MKIDFMNQFEFEEKLTQQQKNTKKRFSKIRGIVKLANKLIGPNKEELKPLDEDNYLGYFDKVLSNSNIKVSIGSKAEVNQQKSLLFYGNHPGGLDSIVASYAIRKSFELKEDLYTTSFEMSTPILHEKIARLTVPVITPLQDKGVGENSLTSIASKYLLNRIYGEMKVQDIQDYNAMSQKLLNHIVTNNKNLLLFPEGANKILSSQNSKWFKGIAKTIVNAKNDISLVPFYIQQDDIKHSSYSKRILTKLRLPNKVSNVRISFGNSVSSQEFIDKYVDKKTIVTSLRDELQSHYEQSYKKIL
jgi:1-acyl-sn-glycerol-3-phosphate acyltransferase